jgi:hypothetical protein
MRLFASILAALLACVVADAHADESRVFPVRVHLHVDRSITTRLLTDVFEDETSAIWQPLGVRLDWTHADESAFDSSVFTLEVFIERGIEHPGSEESSTVLGRAFVELDTPTRKPIRVSLDATASVLATRSVPRVSDRDLARALSRVLAHEIGHVLLGAPYHDQAGLMRAVFLPEELADPDRRPFRLTCNGIARLESRLRALTEDERFIHDDHTLDRTSCEPARPVR